MTREITNESLPQDVSQCHSLITELLSKHNALLSKQDEMSAMLEELHAALRLQEREKAQLLHRVEHLLRQLYGRRTEKIDPAQLLLFAEETARAAEEAAVVPSEVEEEGEAPKKKGHGRKRPPLELPHMPIEHDVPESEKVCSCGRCKTRIGEKISEQLEYAPASLFVIDHIQPVYACPVWQEGVSVAKKPAQPIEKGLPGPGLLAHVVVSKYADHLPLYRQEGIFARHGVDLSRQTLCGWVMAAAQTLEPIVALMKARILESKVIHTDDTPVTVCTPGKTGTHKGRFWVYLGDGDHPYTVYDYTPSRRRDGPATFLETFRGTDEHPRYLQADAFGGYDGIYDTGNGVRECACWAHARRKFYDARTTDVNRAHTMLGWIRRLYEIERDAKELGAQERCALRQEKARGVLDTMKNWLDIEQPCVLPKSPIGEAITYAQNQWKALERYIEDGDLAIDNNAAENSVRGIAVGRKNWLFAGSDRGGRAAAIHYSLIQSAKRHNLDPFQYLRDLFLRIPTHPNKDIALLLPDRWKREILPNLDPPKRP